MTPAGATGAGRAGGTPLVEAAGLHRHYDGARVRALNGVSLAIDPGETVSIIGRSGSGKSTLLNMLAGLDRPSAGSVRFAGIENPRPAAWRRLRAHSIGIVFQAFHLLPVLTALENVTVPMFGLVGDAHARRRRAGELLARVGLDGREGHRPAELSGGERQRVAIARSFANGPALLLADEPTGNLDAETAASVLDMMFALAAEAAIALVIVSHEREIESRTARHVRMSDGRIVSDDGALP